MKAETIDKIDIKKIDDEVKSLMLKNYVSFKTGFLAEEPLRHLPSGNSPEQSKDFKQLDELGYKLEKIIKEKKVAESINKLRIPNWSFESLTREVTHRLMLITAMLTHAYFRETLPYKNVNELMKDTSKKSLPAQLAVPLWNLSKITGIAPSMSYGLYSLWNYYKKDSSKPLTLENVELIHSFTGSLDEKWFVWIHQIVEITFAPAIPELARACLLSKDPENNDETITNEIIKCLDKAAEVERHVVNVLERMRENCSYRSYFDEVRIFYSIPRNIVFEGVDELKGEGQEIYGETGGQTPYMHFLLATLGIKHDEDQYFPNMQKHISVQFRDFLNTFKASKLRDYVEKHKRNRILVRRYNMLVQSVLDWRAEHMSLVDDYIKEFGEVHGTGKPPLTWLKSLYDKTKTFLVE